MQAKRKRQITPLAVSAIERERANKREEWRARRMGKKPLMRIRIIKENNRWKGHEIKSDINEGV